MNKAQKIGYALMGAALGAVLLFAGPALADRTGTTAQYFASNADSYSTLYYNAGPLDIGSSASGIASLFVQGYSNVSFPIFAAASSTGQLVLAVTSNSSTTQMVQYAGFGTPTIATSTGAGTVAGTTTLAVGSTDLAGDVLLVTGSNPVVNQTIFTLTVGSSTAPSPIFCVTEPMNLATGGLYGATTTFMATTSTGFSLKSGTIGLVSTTTYLWNYHCN